MAFHEPEGRIDRAAQADETGLAIFRLEPGRIELVMDRGRAKVPKDWITAPCEQDPARKLVARPFTDLGRGDVADVVVVEQQQRAKVGGFERGLRTAEAIAVHAAVVDTFLKIDAHSAKHGQVPAPVVARVDVFGADLHRFARSLIHGRLLTRY